MQINTLVLTFTCLLPAAAFGGTADIKAANNQVRLQYISTRMDYRELVEEPTAGGNTSTRILDTETGRVAGYAIAASVMSKTQNYYAEAQYSRNKGASEYDHGLFFNQALLTDYSLRLGKGIADSATLMLTPHLEFGHHKWDRGTVIYERYAHNYLGVGMLWQHSSVNNMIFTVNALLGKTFGSRISVSSPFANFSSPLGNSLLYRAGFSIDYIFSRQLHGNGGIDLTSFEYGKSATYNGYYEPSSITRNISLRVGAGYAF